MSRYAFSLAGPEDDAALRGVLAATPMEGAIALRMAREPNYFDAAVVEGAFRQTLVVRDAEQGGRIVGLASRSIARRLVNGAPVSVGYLSQLRLLPGHRGATLLARGYAFLRELHGDGRAAFYLTTVAGDNLPALRLLTAHRAGLPHYVPAGRYHTLAIPLTRPRQPSTAAGRAIRPARAEDLPEVIAFLLAHGPRRQFFPHYEAADFSEDRLLRGMQSDDLFVAYQGARIVGTLGAWNQMPFRQNVIHGYRGALRWLRPAANAWWRLRRMPRLPDPGCAVGALMGALCVVADDDPGVACALVDAVVAARSGSAWDYLLMGLHESDPLLPALRPRAWRRYTTQLYLVAWDREALPALDARPPYLELGGL